MLFNPNRFIRQLCANEALFLSSVSSLLGYNGTPLLPQSDKTPVENKGYYRHNANDRFGFKSLRVPCRQRRRGRLWRLRPWR